MNVPNSIRVRLQAAREAGRVDATQRALAAALGIPEANMSRIVSGETVPSRVYVEAIAQYLACKPEDLYTAAAYQALQTLWDEAAAAQAIG